MIKEQKYCTQLEDITDLSDCDFEYHDIILPSYKKGFIKESFENDVNEKYLQTVEIQTALQTLLFT